MTALLVAQAIVTLALTGLVWFVQLVHYPLFAEVDPGSFPAYEREHTRRTTWIAAPLMATEMIAAGALAILDPGMLTALGMALLAGIWGSTFFVQVPCHRVLAAGWSAPAHQRLVRSNWLRTSMWSARGAIALALLV